MKFEETGDLGVLPGRGQKPVGTETGEDVAAAVIERVSSSIPNGRSVSPVATSSDSFNPNRFPSSSGQPTQISSLFKFYDHLPQINFDMEPFFADLLNDDIHAEQLSVCCRSNKTVLPIKLDFFCKGMINDDKRTLNDYLAMAASLYRGFMDLRKEYSIKKPPNGQNLY
ncbi:hypothetical protein TNCV_1901441 [Trichonephila clavipes]|nr:hypothetical protein TNCV_1901441 [Trichonephila clavipes]